MRKSRLVLFAFVALVAFALAVPCFPALAQQPKAALRVTDPTTNPGVKPGEPPALNAAELGDLAEVTEISTAVARDVQTARLYLEAAERKAESAVYFGQARRLRILAKRGLDPDLWDVVQVTVGPEGKQRQEWQIVPIKPTAPAAKAGATNGDGKGGPP